MTGLHVRLKRRDSHAHAQIDHAGVVRLLAFTGIGATGQAHLISPPAGWSQGSTGPATATEPVHANANTATAITFLTTRIAITP
jgi:hypothetical protein